MTQISVTGANPVIGLIPAAGRATRLPGISGSKELLPVPAADGSGSEPSIAASVAFLLAGGIRRQHVVIAPHKTDIPDLLGDGGHLGARISYTEIAESPSVPASLDAAFDSTDGHDVVLVFPDIMFEPRADIAALLSRWTAGDSDVLLALVPSDRGDKVDIVSLDDAGRVLEIAPKPGRGVSGWTWVAAAWSPRFTRFLHGFQDKSTEADEHAVAAEPYVGDVLNAAISAGLSIHAAAFASGNSIDIGTPDEYVLVWQRSGRYIPPHVLDILRDR